MLRGLAAGVARGDGGAEAPARIKIANWGLDEFRDGKVLVNEAAVAEVRRRMTANRKDRVRIDIAHTTAFKPAAEILPENILGYGDLEAVPGEGLFLCNVTWTDRGRSIWKALPDPSPAFLARASDHMMTQLDSVGLCPDGELELPTLCSAEPSAPAVPGIYLQTITESAMIKTLSALLKKAGVTVPDQGESSDSEYEAVLTAAAADYLGKAEETTEMAGADCETQKKLSALEKRIAEHERKIAGWQQDADKAAKDEILRKCSAEGKVMPLTNEQIFGGGKETAIALSAMEAIYSNLKPTVPVQSGGAARKGDSLERKEARHTLSADQIKINEMMGVSQEEVIKYAGAAA